MGRKPVDLDLNKAITEGSGVYMDEIKKKIEARGFDIPPFSACLDDESQTWIG
jgi:hypothetical protein